MTAYVAGICEMGSRGDFNSSFESQNMKKETFWDTWDMDDPLFPERRGGRLYLSAKPYDPAKVRSYTFYTYPVGDDRSPTGWREQFPLGWYREYDEHSGPNGESVYAFVVRGSSARWFHSCQDAREWIETKTTRVKPDARGTAYAV